MKKFFLIVFILVGLVHAQTNHTHNLYGISEPVNGLFSIGALNQTKDAAVQIDNANMVFTLGAPYDYSRVSTNVYFTQSDSFFTTTMNQYMLPNIDSTIFGIENMLTLQQNMAAMCLSFYSEDYIYAYNKISQKLELSTTSGSFQFSSTGTFELDTNYKNSLVYFSNNLYLSGVGLNGNVAVFRTDTSLVLLDTVSFSFNDIKLFSDASAGIYGIATDAASQHYLITLDSGNLIMNNLGLLPSCLDCQNEVFNYDRNALVIDAENNHFIASRSETINGTTKYYLTTFSLLDGSVVYNIETQERWSNLIFNKPADDLVYPGDANHDKIVNMQDLFPIGIHYLAQVPLRNSISTEWIGHVAQNTGDTLANGVDVKHADCNGDGQINDVDVDMAVITNYNFIHNSNKSIQTTCDFPLRISHANMLKEGDSVSISIALDLQNNLVQDVYGIAFTLEYDTTFVTPNTLRTEGETGWFGTENSNYIQRYVNNRGAAKMDVGVVGIDQLNRNDGGIVIHALWTMEDQVIPLTQPFTDMIFRIKDVKVIDVYENEIDACGVDTTIRVYNKSVGIVDKQIQNFEISPNPVKNEFFSVQHLPNINLVEIYDVKGALVKTQDADFDKIEMNNFHNGLYFVKVHTPSTVYTAKVMLQRKL